MIAVIPEERRPPNRDQARGQKGRMLLGKPSAKKSAVFLNIVQKAFDPPPLYLNTCPILQGVFFKTRFWKFDKM